MAKSGLSSRLGRIREQQKMRADAPQARLEPCRAPDSGATSGAASGAASGASAATESGVISSVADRSAAELPGWELSAPLLYERSATLSLGGWSGSLSPSLPLLFPRERGFLEDALSPSRDTGLGAAPGIGMSSFTRRLAFYDLETTGLSHGAGTVAFMAALGRVLSPPDGGPARLEVHQLLLADYPGEVGFLERFAALAGDDPVFVSFNGKCFDSQILANRYSMNALRPPFMVRPAPHLDLLFPSRRLWKSALGSCRLSAIEAGVLGRERVDDLPGSEAPDAWFDFVRSGRAERLLAIGDHNLEDCRSLAEILGALDLAVASGSGRAALIRAIDLRSRGDYPGAARFLEPLAATGDRTAQRLLAIDSEHRLGDTARALALARDLGETRRIERLEKKLERAQ